MSVERQGSDRLEELYLRHVPDAIRVAYLMTGDRELAEDLAQEAFVRVTARLRHLRDPGSFAAYLRTAVMNLARNHFRHRTVERAHVARAAAQHEVSHDSDGADRETLRRALLDLSHRERAAVVLRYYEDLSDEAIADLLRCRPGTVKSLLHRGVAHLRSALGDLGG